METGYWATSLTPCEQRLISHLGPQWQTKGMILSNSSLGNQWVIGLPYRSIGEGFLIGVWMNPKQEHCQKAPSQHLKGCMDRVPSVNLSHTLAPLASTSTPRYHVQLEKREQPSPPSPSMMEAQQAQSCEDLKQEVITALVRMVTVMICMEANIALGIPGVYNLRSTG